MHNFYGILKKLLKFQKKRDNFGSKKIETDRERHIEDERYPIISSFLMIYICVSVPAV